MFFCDTRNAPYIKTTDRRNFCGKPPEWRRGRVLSWTIPEFCSVAGARIKTALFRVLGCPILRSLQETVLPQINGTVESRDCGTRRKIHWFQKCYSFRPTTKNNEVIAEKTFQNGGVTRGVVNASPSWILTLVVSILLVFKCNSFYFFDWFLS